MSIVDRDAIREKIAAMQANHRTKLAELEREWRPSFRGSTVAAFCTGSPGSWSGPASS